VTVFQGREPCVGTEEEAEWVRKQDFKFWRNEKSSSLPGIEPRHQSSAFHSSRLHCFTPLCCCPVTSGLSHTSNDCDALRSYKSSDERSRRLVELQRGTANVHQQRARPRRLQPTRRMQTRRHVPLLSLHGSSP
jgi:hypothetical protein